MRTQGQAFRAYYASMTDADLLVVAKNRSSFIPIAQTLVTEELFKRQLVMPPDAPAEASRAPTLFTKLQQLLRRELPGRFEPARTEPNPTAQLHRPATGGTVPTDHRTTPRLTSTITSIGATEDQVSMLGIVPERIDKHGTKIEDIAGTGQHDSLGG